MRDSLKVYFIVEFIGNALCILLTYVGTVYVTTHVILIPQLAYVLYRYFRKRSVHSMNFDNPVYKKTTTEDGFHLAGQQRSNCQRPTAPQPQYQHRQYGVMSPEDVS